MVPFSEIEDFAAQWGVPVTACPGVTPYIVGCNFHGFSDKGLARRM